MDDNVIKVLLHCRLCKGMSEEQIRVMMKDNSARVRSYDRGECVFYEGDRPTKIYIFLEGKIAIKKSTLSGNNILVTSIEKPGDMFGEIYLFMDKGEYEVMAEAVEKSRVIEMSGDIFDIEKKADCNVRHILLNNIMTIFATKAYILSNKVRILGSQNIREKIAFYIAQRQDDEGIVSDLPTREEMAEYMNVTRPSLSREIGNMVRDGVIKVVDKKIIVIDQSKLESYL